VIREFLITFRTIHALFLSMTTIPAELALERAKQKDCFDDPINQLQWQLNRLRSDVAELQIQIERTQSGS